LLDNRLYNLSMPGRECYHCKQWIEDGEEHDCWTTTEAAYKSVEDSNEFSVDQVTCLVGKNEAGKTAVLDALYKLNPS